MLILNCFLGQVRRAVSAAGGLPPLYDDPSHDPYAVRFCTVYNRSIKAQLKEYANPLRFFHDFTGSSCKRLPCREKLYADLVSMKIKRRDVQMYFLSNVFLFHILIVDLFTLSNKN